MKLKIKRILKKIRIRYKRRKIAKVRKFFRILLKNSLKSYSFWIFLFFIILAIVYTWPLAEHFNSSIIGQADFTDGPFFLWNLWWVKKALFSFSNPYFTNFTYFPAKVNLSLHTLTVGRAVISIPFQFFFSLITVNNIIQILSITFSGFGTYLLVRYLTRNKIAGMISGIIFAFSPFVWSHLLAGHINLGDLWVIPFATLFWFKMLRRRRWTDTIWAGLFFSIACHNDLQIAFYLAILLFIIFVFELMFSFKNMISKPNLIRYAIFVGVWITLFLLPYFSPWYEFWGKVSHEVTYNNADLRSYFMLNPLNPYLGRENLDYIKGLLGGYRENTLALGYGTMILALFAIILIKRNWQEKIIFLFCAIVFWLLSLGPYLQIGNTISGARLPFWWIQELPFLSVGVVPTRFILVTYFSLAILAGFAIDKIYSWFGKTMLWQSVFAIILIIIVGAVSFEYWSGPMMLTSLEPNSKLLEIIKKDKGNFTVLPAATGSRGGYFQTKFDKLVVSGYLGRRIHDYYLGEYENYPGVRIIAHNNYDIARREDFDRVKVLKSFKSLKIKYIYIDKNWVNGDKVEESRKYLENNIGLHPYKEDKFIILYKI